MREFEIIGGRGHKKGQNNMFLRYLSTDVTDLYGSSIPLIATRRIGLQETPKEIEEDNRHEFFDPTEWKVSQYKEIDTERLGIQYFRVVRMDIFNKLWRKPISVVEYGLTNTAPGTFSLRPYDGNQFYDWCDSAFQLTWPNVDESMIWLYKHNPLVYIFTDGDRMFVDPQDELAFIADIWKSEETKASA